MNKFKLKKIQWAVAIALLSTMTFTSCSDDDPSFDPYFPTTGNSIYIVNQGNYYSGIEGTIGAINYSTGTYVDSLFIRANNISLGNTPQHAIISGSKMFIAVYGSNVIWVVNKQTLKKIAQIQSPAPRYFVAEGKFVYVSSHDGIVTRIDTVSHQTTTVNVGPNPEEMTIANGYLYVTNSDGLNYGNNYENGKTVSKIDLASFREVKKINVGLNPTKIQKDADNNIFVLAMGDYMSTPSVIQKITADDKVTDFAKSQMMAINGRTMYLISDPYAQPGNIKYVSLNTEKGDTISKAFVQTGVASPADMKIDPSNGHIFITSRKSSTEFNSPGYLNEYDSNGVLLKKYNTGIEPATIVFNTK